MRKFNHKNALDVIAVVATILTTLVIIGGSIQIMQAVI